MRTSNFNAGKCLLKIHPSHSVLVNIVIAGDAELGARVCSGGQVSSNLNIVGTFLNTCNTGVVLDIACANILRLEGYFWCKLGEYIWFARTFADWSGRAVGRSSAYMDARQGAKEAEYDVYLHSADGLKRWSASMRNWFLE